MKKEKATYRLWFHGSNQIVEKPVLKDRGYTKDFGYGFYLTEIATQAVKWAKTKARRSGSPFLNAYRFDEQAYEDLDVLRFPEMTEEWLDFINGTISRSDFWVLIRFRYPTHQLVICKEAALDYLSFKEGNEIHE